MIFTQDAYVDVDVHVTVEELYESMTHSEEEEMRNLLGVGMRIRTLEDELKYELVKELFEKKSLKELQDIVNNK